MKKKYGVLIGLVAVLAIAIFINVRINKAALDQPKATLRVDSNAADTPAIADSNGEYFEVFRADRENTREMELEYLDAIITDKSTDAETLADAQQQKLAIVDSMEKEFTVESLLKAKGFEDAAVTFHKGSVNVIIKSSDELTDQQVAQVLDIVCRETGESAQNIKISTARH